MPKVLVPLAHGCEEIEASTIIDILRRANIEVVTAGLDAHPVRTAHGMTFLPDTTLDAALPHDYDMVVLPGGQPGTDNLRADARIRDLMKRTVQNGKYAAAICAAPSVLAAAGLLDGRNATSYPTCLNGFPNIHLKTAAVVEDGKFITSRSPGTAMDFALTLVERLAGQAKRKEVEAALER